MKQIDPAARGSAFEARVTAASLGDPVRGQFVLPPPKTTGVNRANGDRTAPYWRHVMVIDLYVAVAPVDLIYVAHGERMHDVNAEERRLYASVDAAFIGQNVYLFCASENLGTVFRGALDTAALGRSLRLGSDITQ
jgi:hypothetical protein